MCDWPLHSPLSHFSRCCFPCPYPLTRRKPLHPLVGTFAGTITNLTTAGTYEVALSIGAAAVEVEGSPFHVKVRAGAPSSAKTALVGRGLPGEPPQLIG